MPVAFDQMNAKTSNYQDNGPLNALVHVFASVKDGQPVIQPNLALQRELSQAFYDEWGTYLSLQQLAEIVQHTTDPMHREMLLGPVLRRMLSEEETGQGDSGSAQVSVEAVAKLGKRFGIRVESYKTPEGIKAEIKEALLKSRPSLADPQQEETLQRLVDKEFRSITNNPTDPRNPGADGLKDFLAETDDRVEEDSAEYCATLRLLRKDKGYRFQAINQNVDLIITADHNSSQGYKTPCDYAQAAPILREQLRAEVKTAVAAAANNDYARQTAISTAMQNNTARLFSEYQSGPAKSSKTGDTAKGGFDGMMEGLLGNVSTFFSGDVFGSVKGISGLIESIFGPIMKMLMGFQETMFESAQKPGDPFSKKEMDKYTAESEELGKAARDFSLKAIALSEDTAELYEKWRANPDSTEVWVDLIEGLVEDQQLAKADKCLREQEARLLQTLEGLKTDHADDVDATHRNNIQTLINGYNGAIAPLEESDFRTDKESIVARLSLFQEANSNIHDLSKQHAELKRCDQEKQRVETEGNILQAERMKAGAAIPPALAARFAQVQQQFRVLNEKSRNLHDAEDAGLTQDRLVEPIAQLYERCRIARDQIEDRRLAPAARI